MASAPVQSVRAAARGRARDELRRLEAELDEACDAVFRVLGELRLARSRVEELDALSQREAAGRGRQA